MSDRWPSWRCWRVWQRNATTFRRVWATSLVGHLAEPVFYLLGFGLGLGGLVAAVEGQQYAVFLAAGLIAGAATMSACFEGAYACFVRLHQHRTYDAVLATPLSVADLAAGEILWSATKGLISALFTLAVSSALGLIPSSWVLVALPAILLQGLAFGGVALAVAAQAPSVDALEHFYALFLAPNLLLSGVFFPLEQLPAPFRVVAAVSPLTHAVELSRWLAQGETPPAFGWSCAWLLLTAAAGVAAGTLSLRHRMIS